MLVESVSVRNFKLFGDFAVEGLRPVTLLGGDNGCGKTTLLEALLACFNRKWSDKGKWSDKELPPIFNHSLRDPSIANEDAFTRLVHGGGEFGAPIVVSCLVDGVEHTVRMEPHSDDMVGYGAAVSPYMVKTESGVYIPRPAQSATVKYLAEYADGGEDTFGELVVTVSLDGYNIRPLDREKAAQPKKNRPFSPFRILFMWDGGLGVGEQGMNVPNNTDLLSELEIKGDKAAVLDALQLVAPKATDVAVASIRNKPLMFVQMEGMKTKLPATMLGTGARKLLSLVLALHSIENGLCLLDEVTVGWHHSHLADLWRMIFRVCKERNHQVVATTHSREGIAAFAQAAQDEEAQDDSCYIRLGPAHEGDSPGKINPVYYTYERLHAALEMGVKVL